MASRPDQQDALRRLRALVMQNETLQAALRQAEGERFVALATSGAAAEAIPLAPDTVRAAMAPDTLGLARFSAAPPDGTHWPPDHWLPVHVAEVDGRLFVDWAHFGGAPLTEPFFEQSTRFVLAHPFNRVFRYRMSIEDFVARANVECSLAPSGFIFHMSRCGSTLVSRMLAALPATVVVSEAPPIDAAVQLSRLRPELPAEQRLKALTTMIAAFGRRRGGNERHYVIKLDAWHTLALPLLARAFPAVPWLFLYRHPVEVLVSQLQMPGMQMIPQFVPRSLYGIDTCDGNDDYYARVLAKICEAALDRGGGLFVNYRDLPQAVFTKILPYFRISCSEREHAIMAEVTRFDAKMPQLEFTNDSAEKRRQASERTRALAERHLGEIYRRLEAASGSASAAQSRAGLAAGR